MISIQSSMMRFCRSLKRILSIVSEKILRTNFLKIKAFRILMRLVQLKALKSVIWATNWRLIAPKSISVTWLTLLIHLSAILLMIGQSGLKIHLINCWSRTHRLSYSHVLHLRKCMRHLHRNFIILPSWHAGEICKMQRSPRSWRLSRQLTSLKPVRPKSFRPSWTWLNLWSSMKFQTLCSAAKL